MDVQDILNLQEAYMEIVENQQLDEVRGGGRIDPVSDFPHHGERGSRSPKDAGLKMSPIDRAEARANALRKRENPEATKRANRIQNRFVGPTKRGIGRAINASNIARTAEKQRFRQQEQVDIYDIILSHLLDEGYAINKESAVVIMANMSENWRNEILDEARVDAGLSDKEKRAERRKRNETSGLDFFHTISRGKKKVPGRKTSYDKEGNMIRKYKHMQDAKRSAKKDAENAEYNERQRVQSKGTWYKD